MFAIINRSPFTALTLGSTDQLTEDLGRLLAEFWPSWEPAKRETRLAHIDVFEEEEALVVKAELPGVEKEDLDISLEGDSLLIRAEKKAEKKENAEGRIYYIYERWYGSYSRRLTMPFPVNAEEAGATFQDGVLEIRLPRAEEARTKQIRITPA